MSSRASDLNREAAAAGGLSTAGAPPSRSHALSAAWRDYFRRAGEAPHHPAARDFMDADLQTSLARLIPGDATVLEAGCGLGDLLASLPNPVRKGIDFLPEMIDRARIRHPDIAFEVDDATAPEPLPGAKTGAEPRLWDAIVCDRLCHSVLDIRALLAGLRRRLSAGGRIYLTAFNYFWETPARVAELAGWKRRAPTSNWLTETDFRNLFDITGLEVVRYEDRLILPLEVPGASSLLNRYLVRVPGFTRLSLYRVYVLRERERPLVAAAAATPARRRGGSNASVSVIVPTRNEAGNVKGAIDRTPVMGGGTELIFVEGGSTDGTWQTIQDCIANYRGPLKLSAYQQTGKGKGDAVRLGFSKASGDLLMILDADLTVPPEDLPEFFEIAARGHGDFVQGTRLVYPMEPGAMRFFNRMGNVAFSQLFSYLLQQPIKDTLCGTKVLWRADYERIAAARHYFGDFDPFGDFDLIFGAARLNLKITEIPVRYRDRTYGETNISRWKHGWLLLRMSAVAARKLKFV
ncbi:MAG TPA: glycosyltransferase [Polyangia bacterium]|jgi:SAM-dependent methyltransferase|nr:glycosyltransferase [Polyangia bacterium]